MFTYNSIAVGDHFNKRIQLLLLFILTCMTIGTLGIPD
jgi:hypothetical protein